MTTMTTNTRPTDAEVVQLLRRAAAGTRAHLHNDTTYARQFDAAAHALEAAQETAPPMTPERAGEVEIMYRRAEAATAIVTAAVQWRKYPINWQAELQTAIDRYNALPR